MNILETKVLELIQEVAKEQGLEIVLIKMLDNQGILQIMIEKTTGESATLDDCANFSKAIAVLLDVSNLITSSYRLEISSCGINRLLVKKEDYERFKNNNIILKTKLPLDGQKNFKGYLKGLENSSGKESKIKIIINNETTKEEKEILIEFELIDKASLELIRLEDHSRSKNAKNK
ncbi:Ribosome maturation factor RimP [Candidatus Hepatincolaceae symbiont of Richtersius coronifer]